MKVELRRKTLLWYWCAISRNGEVMFCSETYYSKANAKRSAEVAARRLKAEVIERRRRA